MVSGETSPLLAARLQEYERLVRTYAPRLDLVSEGDLARFGERHVADCLRARAAVAAAPAGPAVDVGSGAGLPGVVLAIADDGRPWRLIEPRRRRAAFLEEVVRALELQCEVLRVTAQEAARDSRLARAHAVATARAVAAPPEAVALLRPLVRPGGICVVFAGAAAPIPAQAVAMEPGLFKVEVEVEDGEA